MMQIRRAELARMFPRALPQWLTALEELAPKLLEHYRFDRLDWCGMCGQIDAECDGLALARMEEHMSMDAASIMRLYSYRLGVAISAGPVFGRTYTSKAALARDLAHNATKLADVVYGGPTGREGTPPWQGSLYIGRGPMQETHLNNYRAARDEIRKQPGGEVCPDLVDEPQALATSAELGVRDIFAQWKLKGLSRYARRQDWTTLSDVLNTGNPNDNVRPHGLPRRLRATARALAIWPVPTPVAVATPTPASSGNDDQVASLRPLGLGDSGDDVRVLQTRLNDLQFHVGATDGHFGLLTKRAVVAFQAEHDLTPDGCVGPRTREVIAAAVPADLGARTTITAADLAAAGSETAQTTQRARRGLRAAQGLSIFEGLDQFFDLGAADTMMSKLEQVQGLLGRSEALMPKAAVPAGSATIVVLCVGVFAAAWLLRRMFVQIEARRVADARTGANLGRGPQ